MTAPFERTVCGCADDVANCVSSPGYLGVDDAAKIARHLGERTVNATFFRRGRAVVGRCGSNGKIEAMPIDTIVPAKRDGRCVFLTANNLCAIHEVAPFGCAYFDVHMSHAEADRRSLWMLNQLAVDGDYRALALSLPPKIETFACSIDEGQQ